MARKTNTKTAAKAKSAGIAKIESATPVIVGTSPIRHTPIPKEIASAPIIAKANPAAITFDRIAFRAYEISISGNGGSQDDNWYRAERELNGL